MLAIADIQRDRRHARAGERHDFLPSLETHEQEIFVLADGASEDAAKLVLVVPAFCQSGVIVGKVVGIQNTIAEIIVNVTVPVVCPTPNGGVDYAARLVAVGRIIGRGDGGKFLNRVDAGGKVPLAAIVADDSAVQRERVVAVAGARAVELVTGVHVPSTGARETGCSELLLREDHARSQAE